MCAHAISSLPSELELISIPDAYDMAENENLQDLFERCINEPRMLRQMKPPLPPRNRPATVVNPPEVELMAMESAKSDEDNVASDGKASEKEVVEIDHVPLEISDVAISNVTVEL